MVYIFNRYYQKLVDMKYFISVIIICSLNSCFRFGKNEVLMAKHILTDGTIIEIRYIGYGATTPSVVWASKKPKNEKNIIIGKILNFNDRNKVNITQVDNGHINIRLTDTIIFKGKFNDFFIDLNNKIEPNDGSPYATDTIYNPIR